MPEKIGMVEEKTRELSLLIPSRNNRCMSTRAYPRAISITGNGNQYVEQSASSITTSVALFCRVLSIAVASRFVIREIYSSPLRMIEKRVTILFRKLQFDCEIVALR